MSSPPSTSVAEARGILAFEWVMVGFSVLMVLARFYVRRTVLKKIYADDWLILVALCLQIVFQVLETLGADATIRMNGEVGNAHFIVLTTKYAALAVGPAYIECAVVRISATVFLVRIFSSIALKWYLIALTTLQAIFSVLVVSFFYTSAKPVTSLWDPSVPSDINAQSMFNTFWLSITLAVTYTLSDLTYVLFPTIIIWRKVQMSTARKVGLTILMLCSLLMVAASITRAIITLNAGLKNTKTIYKGLWASFEQSLVIIVTCLPPLLPVTKLDKPFINKTKNAFNAAVQRLSDKFGSGRNNSHSRDRPSFVRTVSDHVRRHTGISERRHSLHSDEDVVEHERRTEMVEEGKYVHGPWGQAGSGTPSASNQTSTQ